MTPDLIQAFVVGCITLMVGGFVFFAKRWIDSVDGLKTAITTLNGTLTAVSNTQTLHGERLEQHRGEIDELWRTACQNENCPYHTERRRSN